MEGLLEEDHTRQKLPDTPCREQHLPVGAPVLLVRLYAHCLEPLPDGAEALVRGEDAPPRGYEFPRGLLERLNVHPVLLPCPVRKKGPEQPSGAPPLSGLARAFVFR